MSFLYGARTDSTISVQEEAPKSQTIFSINPIVRLRMVGEIPKNMPIKCINHEIHLNSSELTYVISYPAKNHIDQHVFCQ